MTKEKYDDMKRGIKSPLGFIRLVDKVVEFDLNDDARKPKLFDPTPRDIFYSFPEGTRLTGIVKMVDPQMLRVVIFITPDFFYNEGEVDVNSIRVLPLEESIIWKLTNE